MDLTNSKKIYESLMETHNPLPFKFFMNCEFHLCYLKNPSKLGNL